MGSSSSNTYFLKAASAAFAQLQTVNGNATLVLTLNGAQVASASLDSSSVDAITFPVQSLINSSIAVPGQILNIGVNVVNVSLDRTATRDFRVVSSFTYHYTVNASYVPPPPLNLTNDLTVTLTVGKTPIGLDAQNNKYFNYTVVLQNMMTAGASASGPVNLAIGAPSCLSLDTDYANNLVNTQQIVGWEIVDNGVSVILLKSFAPGEVRTLNIQFQQKNAGTCLIRDNIAYQTNGDVQLTAATKVV